MRVLLVYANRSRDLLPPPPVGLAYVAQATRAAGHEVRLLDVLTARRPLARVRRALRQFRPEVVGLSVRSIDNVTAQRFRSHLEPVADLLAAIRRDSKAPVVLGGPAVSVLGRAALDHLNADYAVVGEGEAAFPRLLEAFADGGDAGAVPGVLARSADVGGRPPQRLATFGASGLEDWIDWTRYEARGGTWPIQTTRGCSERCAYCVYPAIEGCRERRRDVGEVVDEIERVASKVGPRTFEIVDSTFNQPHDRALELCEAIARRRLKVNLTATSVNPAALSCELLDAMRRAGFIAMMVTPEAASDSTLAALGKGFGREGVVRGAALASSSGIPSAWFFLLGGPGETEATADETVSFMEEHLAGDCFLSIATTGIRVLPGAPLAHTAASEGVVPPDADLALPVFYRSPAVSEHFLLERVNRAIRAHPNIVHTAEESNNVFQRVCYAWLRRRRVPPPHWRFLPRLLAWPPIRAARGRTVEF